MKSSILRTHPRRARRHAGFAVALTALVLPGCFFLGEDDPGRDALELRITARAEEPAARGAGSTCPDPLDLLNDTDRLSGFAEIFCLPSGADTERLAGSGAMSVTRLSVATLELFGDLEVEVGPSGSEYRVVVKLLYQGTEIDGSYSGGAELESGIEIDIDSLELLSTSLGSVRTLSSTICVSSDAVDDGAPFCHTEDDATSPVTATYDTRDNLLLVTYETDDTVEWEGETREGIIVDLQGGLVPTAIFEGESVIPFLVPGSRTPTDVPVIALTPTTLQPRFPQDAGERFEGTLGIRFADGLPPSEIGHVSLVRTETACDE